MRASRQRRTRISKIMSRKMGSKMTRILRRRKRRRRKIARNPSKRRAAKSTTTIIMMSPAQASRMTTRRPR